MINIQSHNEFIKEINGLDKSYLLLYKKGAGSSECAYKSIDEAYISVENLSLFKADVNNVKDIHGKYSVDSVPTLLEFEGSQLKNIYKGCNDTEYYKLL